MPAAKARMGRPVSAVKLDVRALAEIDWLVAALPMADRRDRPGHLGAQDQPLSASDLLQQRIAALKSSHD